MPSAFKLPSRALSPFAVVVLSLVLLASVACAPSSPTEQVTTTRAEYTVQLNSWLVKDESPVVEGVVEGVADALEAAGEAVEDAVEAVEETLDLNAEGADATAEGADETGEDAAAALEADANRTILFDLIVRFSGSDPLPGITVDVTQADAAGNEKRVWREFLDIPNIVKSQTKQVSFELETELAEGDQFSVQLANYVDPANYGEYKEYAEAQ